MEGYGQRYKTEQKRYEIYYANKFEIDPQNTGMKIVFNVYRIL